MKTIFYFPFLKKLSEKEQIQKFINKHGTGAITSVIYPQDMAVNPSRIEEQTTTLYNFLNLDAGSNMPLRDNEGRYKEDARIDATPKSVFSEISTFETIDISGIDDKIQMLKDRISLISLSYSKKDIEGLIERLEYRKKYDEYKHFFEQFKNTDDEKIAVLINKYKLKLGNTDLFIPEFSKEAITTMNEYKMHVKELTGKDPVFYVIAQEKDFQQRVIKRDPILLAQSPFGYYWQILGAWDEEMLLLSEL